MSEVHRLRVEVPAQMLEMTEEVMGEGAPTVSCFSLDDRPPYWCVEVFHETLPDLAPLQARLAVLAAAFEVEAPELQLERIEAQDWVALSQAAHKPVDAGRFFVHGPHDAHLTRPGRCNIEIPASQAFGTGQHQTTHGCLLAIEKFFKRQKKTGPGLMNVLDMGTGSGILAIAMAKGFHQPVMTSDIDPLSVELALENARTNGVPHLIHCVEAEGFGHSLLRQTAPYDLIVANILANPLMTLAPQMARYAAPGGSLILAGLLDRQERAVRAAYRMQGFVLEDRIVMGEWPTLMLRRQD